jgi:GTP pyrophosphokinase
MQDTSVATQLTTMLLDMGDVRAVLVVLASKLQHMRSNAAAAASGTIDLRVEAEEGLRVFAPLANRLGVWKLKAELEDLCFMVLFDDTVFPCSNAFLSLPRVALGCV